MKRVLIGLLLAFALLATAELKTADAGIYIGWGHGHYRGGYGYWNRGFYGRGYYGGWGYRSFYRPYYSYYPRTFIRYSVPYYRSYYRAYYPSYYSYPSYYGGFGCANNTPNVVTPGIVATPVAPVYADASSAYGPDAVKEFLGLDRDFAKGPLAPTPLVVNAKPVEAERAIVAAPAEEKAERVPSNVAARQRAARFVSFGDDQFGDQEYHSAAQRYRFAIEAAPDVAGAHFRQGFAYVASNRYELAAKAFRRGLELDPMWVNSAFRVDDLYGRNKLAKGSHLDGLAKSALIDRGNSDFYFLIGVMLHFDGQQDRAKKFFERADKLSGDKDAHIQAFLNPPLPRAEDAI